MSYDFNMIKKPVISFAKKKQDTEKHSSFVQKEQAKTPQNRGCKTVLWGFCHKNGDEKFLKANNYENGEKNSSNLVQYSIEIEVCQILRGNVNQLKKCEKAESYL